ncbi:fimbrial protein [Enterobacter asburiae]|nr:fimbrial protein [Enterobacter asburiae]
MMKRLYFLMIPFLAVFSVQCLAGDNSCTAKYGTKQFIFDMGNKTITNPEEDATGKTYPNIYDWSGSGTFDAICNCPGSYTPYYKGTSSLPLGHNDGNQYYRLNENLEVLTKIYLITTSGSLYFPVPFLNLKSTNNSAKCPDQNFTSASKGSISIYISKPIIGTVSFNSVKIASLYIASAIDSYGNTPVADVVMSGTITAPQNCKINSGQAITVDLGTIEAKKFTHAGMVPDDYTQKKFSIGIKCNDIAAQAQLSLKINATPSPNYNAAISTNNEDIGVIIGDSNGTAIDINTNGALNFHLDNDYSSVISLTAWPTSTTGKMPVAGEFQAAATLDVTFK